MEGFFNGIYNAQNEFLKASASSFSAIPTWFDFLHELTTPGISGVLHHTTFSWCISTCRSRISLALGFLGATQKTGWIFGSSAHRAFWQLSMLGIFECFTILGFESLLRLSFLPGILPLQATLDCFTRRPWRSDSPPLLSRSASAFRIWESCKLSICNGVLQRLAYLQRFTTWP